MYGLSISEILFMAIVFVPLLLFQVGMAVLYMYIIYLKFRDSFSHMLHLPHRRAH